MERAVTFGVRVRISNVLWCEVARNSDVGYNLTERQQAMPLAAERI
jgi:hypothetical protein